MSTGLAVAQDAGGLGLQADQALDRLGGAALRLGFEIAPEQDQRHDHRGGFVIDVVHAGAAGAPGRKVATSE